jgi:hypothetical protein
MQAKHHSAEPELKISRQKPEVKTPGINQIETQIQDAGLDEISIDIRGNLHHANEDTITEEHPKRDKR